MRQVIVVLGVMAVALAAPAAGQSKRAAPGKPMPTWSETAKALMEVGGKYHRACHPEGYCTDSIGAEFPDGSQMMMTEIRSGVTDKVTSRQVCKLFPTRDRRECFDFDNPSIQSIEVRAGGKWVRAR